MQAAGDAAAQLWRARKCSREVWQHRRASGRLTPAVAASGAAAAVCTARCLPQDTAGDAKLDRRMHCAVGRECSLASAGRGDARMVPRRTASICDSLQVVITARRVALSMRGLGDHAGSTADQKHAARLGPDGKRCRLRAQQHRSKAAFHHSMRAVLQRRRCDIAAERERSR